MPATLVAGFAQRRAAPGALFDEALSAACPAEVIRICEGGEVLGLHLASPDCVEGNMRFA